MKNLTLFVLITALSFALGCSSGTDATQEVRSLGKQYLLPIEPGGAIGVINAREDTQDGEQLVMVGRVGGAENPWIDGRAAFTVLDASMTIVPDGQEASEGEICLEDCCASELIACTALVKVVDSDGKLVPYDSRELLGILDSDMVVTTGRAQRDDNGNFVMLASGVYIRR